MTDSGNTASNQSVMIWRIVTFSVFPEFMKSGPSHLPAPTVGVIMPKLISESEALHSSKVALEVELDVVCVGFLESID